jgi:hypothetical protein
MKSRIHLALGYEQPGLEARRKLWMLSLQSIPPDEIGLDPDDAVDALVTATLNGREIANAINTAQTIARFEKKPLQLSHIETVLEVRKAFDASLKRAMKKSTLTGDGSGRMFLARRNSILVDDNEEFKS